jgi:predicted transcriptional regulator
VEDKPDVLTLTTEIVASYVGANSHVQASEIPDIIRSVRAALMEDVAPAAAAEPQHQRATPAQIRKSVTPDALYSFVDNKPYKTLKRHLTRHGMTFDEYRQRYGLPGDYPSVAPNYSVARSQMAKQLGLGARGRGRPPAPPAKPAARRKGE